MTHTTDIVPAFAGPAGAEFRPDRIPRLLYHARDGAARRSIEKFRSRLELLRCDRLDDLAVNVRAREPAIVVAELTTEPGGAAPGIIAAVRRAQPALYLIGLVSYSTTSGDAMAGMVRAGLDAVSLRESGTLGADIETAIRVFWRASPLVELSAELRLEEVVHPVAASVVGVAVAAASWPNVSMVARALECSPRELQRRFVDAGLGLPSDLLQTTRWVLASAALRASIRDQRQVATALGFATRGAMRDALRRSLSIALDQIASDTVATLLWTRLIDQFRGDRISFIAHAPPHRNRLALTATLYNFEVNLSDVDRNVYETISFKAAQQPSETDEYLIARILAYILEYAEGIGFSGGIAEADQPAIFVRDLTGALKVWIDIGSPEAARLHKASKAAPRVAVYTHKDPAQILRQLAGERIHRSEALELYAIDRELVAGLVRILERRMKIDLSVTDRHLFLSIGDVTLSGAVERVRLDA